MPVVVSRSVRVCSRLSVVLSIVCALSCLMQLCNLVAIRRARSRLQLDHAVTDVVFARLVRDSVRDQVSNYLSSVPLPSGVSVSFPTSRVPRVVSCDLATWETVRERVPRAMIDGVECGVGDYCSFGLVKSIRPKRVICQVGSDFVILAASTSPGAGSLAAPPPGKGSGGEVGLPSW